MFDVCSYKKRFDANKVKVLKSGGHPYIVRMSGDNGQKGLIDESEKYLNPGNTISFGQDTATMFYQEKPYFTGDKIKILMPKDARFGKSNAQFFLATMRRTFQSFSWGTTSFCIGVLKDQSISLPVTADGKIDFVFMEDFIRELEEERIRELAAYLKVSGLADSKLSASERKALDQFGKSRFTMFQLDELFYIDKTSGFNSDRLVDGNEYDYITRTSFNQGILKSTGRVDGREVNPAGTWSLGLLQMDFFYRKKPWYAGQFVRKITPKIPMSELVCQFFTGIFNKQKKQLLSVLVRDVDITFKSSKVVLPVTASGLPDYDYMETFMRAVQKLVVKDVADFAAKRVSATKKCGRRDCGVMADCLNAPEEEESLLLAADENDE